MSSKNNDNDETKERKPVRLSKNEALYPPKKNHLIIAGVTMVIAIVALVILLVTNPLPL